MTNMSKEDLEKIEQEFLMEDVVKALGHMTVMEMLALIKELEQKWGVKAEPPKMETTQTQDQTAVEQTEFTVTLTSVPADKKISAIKAIREVLGLGLKEAKDFTENTPKLVKGELSKNDATDLETKLVAAGCVVEVK